MTADALAAYKEAVALEPREPRLQEGARRGLRADARVPRGRGRSTRRSRRSAKDKGDKALARECRTRIVTLWGLEHMLEQELPGLRRQFGATPPDLEAGRTLAEVLTAPAAGFRRPRPRSGGSSSSRRATPRATSRSSASSCRRARSPRRSPSSRSSRRSEPKRARELYQRMAQYALQIYNDDDAIKYAARAVELNPDDAEGHRRLGEMYRSRQDVDHAIAEFRAAIAKNDRLFVVYFELADLLLSKGQTDEADRLFRVDRARGAPDEELVARAARLSMQINLGKGTLESLEQDLLPLAIGNPQQPIYRRLLVEIYGSLTFGLVQRVHARDRRGGATTRAQALARVGSRAVKPLLDALADPDVSQQRIAIDVLAYVQNRNAALPLFAFATGPAEPALRVRAMIACGALADAALVPKYEALLFPKDALGDPAGRGGRGRRGRGVGAGADGRSARLCRCSVAWRATGTPPMRALAVLGLGRAHDGASAARGRGDRARRSTRERSPARRRRTPWGSSTRRRSVARAHRDRRGRRDASAADGARGARADGVESRAPRSPRGSARPCRRWPTRSSWATRRDGRARARPRRSRETAVAALSTWRLAGTAGGARAGRRRAERRSRVPDGRARRRRAARRPGAARCVGGGSRGGAGARSPSRSSGRRSRRCARRGRERRAVLDALGTGQGELVPFVHAGATGAGGGRGARHRGGARAERRAARAKPGSGDPDEGDRARRAVAATTRRSTPSSRPSRTRTRPCSGSPSRRSARRTVRPGRRAGPGDERRRRAAWRRSSRRTRAGRCAILAAQASGGWARRARPRAARRPHLARRRGREGPVRPRPPGGARGAGLVRPDGRADLALRAGRAPIPSRASARRRARWPARLAPMRLARAVGIAALRSAVAALLGGCRDLSGFSTTDGDSYDSRRGQRRLRARGHRSRTRASASRSTPTTCRTRPGAISTDDGLFHRCRSGPSRRSGTTRSRRCRSARAA